MVDASAQTAPNGERVVPGRAVLTIDGMFCAACAASVEAALLRVRGVTGAAVNFAADAAIVEWRSAETGPQRLLEVIAGLGYQATMLGADAAHRATPAAVSSTARQLELLPVRLAVAALFGMWVMLPSAVLYFDAVAEPVVRWWLAAAAGLLALPVLTFSGWPFYRMALATVRHGVAGVDLLITLGVLGSLALSAWSLVGGGSNVYFEVAVTLIAFQLIARLLDARVRRQARAAVAGLLELAPTRVLRINPSGEEQRIALGSVETGDLLKLRPGERSSVDGIVMSGEARLDRSLLTGESAAVQVTAGDPVFAGEQVLDGALQLRVTGTAGQRRMDTIARQMRALLAARPPWQRFVDVIARWFIVFALTAAVLGALLAFADDADMQGAAQRALAAFVVACPCALALAAPLTGMIIAGAAARRGMVLRDLSALTVAACPTLLFLDKTGTLTLGRPQLTGVEVLAAGESRDSVLALAAAAERDAEHPLARAILAAAPRCAPVTGRLRTAPGGVSVQADATVIHVGNERFFTTQGIALPARPESTAMRVWVARDRQIIGLLEFADRPRPGLAATIDELRRMGLSISVLSGDRESAVNEVAGPLGLAAVGGLTPEEKVAHIIAAQSRGYSVAFLGDGLNDAPALAAADLGVAVCDAADAANAAAGVILLRSGVDSLPQLLVLLRRGRRLIRQNLILAVCFNVGAVSAALAGLFSPVLAAAAMGLSSILVLINALRAGSRRKSTS